MNWLETPDAKNMSYKLHEIYRPSGKLRERGLWFYFEDKANTEGVIRLVAYSYTNFKNLPETHIGNEITLCPDGTIIGIEMYCEDTMKVIL